MGTPRSWDSAGAEESRAGAVCGGLRCGRKTVVEMFAFPVGVG